MENMREMGQNSIFGEAWLWVMFTSRLSLELCGPMCRGVMEGNSHNYCRFLTLERPQGYVSRSTQAVSRNISDWIATLIRARRPQPFPNTFERGQESGGFYYQKLFAIV
jgi:hypothetical protein